VSIRVFTNARAVGAEFTAAAVAADSSVRKTIAHHAMLLQTKVKSKASGRPGPRAVTGDYRRSISRRVSTHGPMTVGQVGTNSPQGRRLEMGFTGTDSLGRYYDQPPYPHFGPALDEIQKPFLGDLADTVQDLLGGRGPA